MEESSDYPLEIVLLGYYARYQVHPGTEALQELNKEIYGKYDDLIWAYIANPENPDDMFNASREERALLAVLADCGTGGANRRVFEAVKMYADCFYAGSPGVGWGT